MNIKKGMHLQYRGIFFVIYLSCHFQSAVQQLSVNDELLCD